MDDSALFRIYFQWQKIGSTRSPTTAAMLFRYADRNAYSLHSVLANSRLCTFF